MPTMKIDGFLKVPDIKGPSTRDGHDDEIEIHGVDYKMVAPYDPNSLSRRGRVSMGMIKFTKHYDKSSPYLAKALFENKALDEVGVLRSPDHRRREQGLSGRHPDGRLDHRNTTCRRRTDEAGPDPGGGRLRLQEDQVRL